MSDDAELAGVLAATLPDLDAHPDLPDDVVDLLHCLGFVYLRHGQATRATVLLMLAARAGRDRVEILRTLAAAMIGAGLGDQALAVLDRICAIDPAAGSHRMIALMRARALLLLDRGAEARALFQAEVAPHPAPVRAA